MWAVKKADGLWIFTIDYHNLNSIIPSITSALLDTVVEMQKV